MSTLVRKYLTVEPVLGAFMFCIFLITAVEQQLIYRKTCFTHYNEACDAILHRKNKSLVAFENVVQKKATEWLILREIAMLVPSVLATLCYGSISEHVGRKFLMVFPFIGGSIQAVNLIINSYFIHASVPLLFVGTVVSGCFGNFACVLAGVFSYISDITEKKSRTLRNSILEAMVFVGGACGEIVGGIILNKYASSRSTGFIATFGVALGVYLLTLVYILVYLSESHFPPREKKLSDIIFSCEHIVRVVKVTVAPRKESRRMHLFVLLCVFTVQVMVFVAALDISILYVLHYPLKWPSSLLGYYLAAGLVSKGCGTLIGLPLLLKKLKLHDYTLVIGGLLSAMGMYIISGFGQATWVMFAAVVVGIGSGIPAPCIRSVLTKLVHKNEQASIMALVACLDVIATFLAHVVFDGLYNATVSWYPGFGFFVMAGLLFIPVLPVGFLKWRHRHDVTYVTIDEPKDDTGKTSDLNPPTSEEDVEERANAQSGAV